MCDVNIYTNCIDTQRDGFDKNIFNMSVNSQFQLTDNVIVQIIVSVFKRHCIPTSWHSLRTLRVNAIFKKNCFFALGLL